MHIQAIITVTQMQHKFLIPPAAFLFHLSIRDLPLLLFFVWIGKELDLEQK